MPLYSTEKMKIPVLAYHRVLDEPHSELRSPYAMTRKLFRQQMQYLASNGFKTIRLHDLFNQEYDQARLIAITFDDGYEDNFDQALPVLQEYGFNATFFVIANRIGTDCFMSLRNLRSLLLAGMDVQSHTFSHRALTSLPPSDIMDEFVSSKEFLEEHLHKKVDFVSFPHGIYDRDVLEFCRQAGYYGCCNSDFGYFEQGSDPFRVNRFMVKRDCGISTFSQMVQGNWKFALKVGVPKRIKQEITRIIGFERYQSLYRALYRVEETVT